MSDQFDPSIPPTQPTAELREGRRPDPGSRGAARIAWVLLIVMVGLVVWMQQSRASAPAAPPVTSQVVPEPNSGFSFTARLVLRMMTALRDLDAQSTPQGGVSPNAASMDANSSAMVTTLDSSARTPAERLRLAITANELGSKDSATKILDKLESDLKPNTVEDMPPVYKVDDAVRGQLLDDVGTVRAILDKQDVAPGQTQALVDRHGWFGKVALAHDKPRNDPARVQLLSGGLVAILLLMAIGLGAVALFVASMVCFVIWFIRSASGRSPAHVFEPPVPGGSVYLETVAAFVAAFLALRLVSTFVFGALFTPGNEPEWLETATLGLQWLVLPSIFYPMLRGVSWSQWKLDMGWHTGRGVFREIGSGIFAYLAGFPLVIGAVLISMIALMIRVAMAGGKEPPTPSNPVVDIVTSGDAMTLVLLYSLVSIWAPVVEESIFRGALFRHLRSRMGVIAAAVASAVVFGVMHGYEWMLLSPVIALGLIFAMMRDRRGSLIGPVVMHALHNGILMACMLAVLKLSGE